MHTSITSSTVNLKSFFFMPQHIHFYNDKCTYIYNRTFTNSFKHIYKLTSHLQFQIPFDHFSCHLQFLHSHSFINFSIYTICYILYHITIISEPVGSLLLNWLLGLVFGSFHMLQQFTFQLDLISFTIQPIHMFLTLLT